MTTIYTKAQIDAQAAQIGQRIKYVRDNVFIIDQNTGNAIEIWTGTQVQYDAITIKNPITLYVVKS